MAGVEGQAVRIILWLMRTGNCWHETPHWTMGRGSRWPPSWEQEESRPGRGLKGLSLLSPPGATFALYHSGGFRAQGTEGGPEASPLGGRVGREGST